MLTLPPNTLLLDIETSGLNRQNDRVISIGIITGDSNDCPIIKHYFLETKEEEKSLLESFLLFLKNIQSIYAYGGRAFDYPFLLSRMENYGLDTSDFLKIKLIDMKDALKHFGGDRKSLENALHFQRQSTSKGKDILKLYRTFEASKEPLYRDLIFKHQKDELLSLLAFLELYRTLIRFDCLSCMKQIQSSTEICLHFKANTPFSYSFTGQTFDWKITYEKECDQLSVSLPVINQSLKQYLQPIKDYYYIDSQKQLMHKSLAQFIPSSLKRRATKEECVIRKASTYIKLYSNYKVQSSVWYDDLGSIYIDCTDMTPELLSQQLFSLFFNRKIAKGEKASHESCSK